MFELKFSQTLEMPIARDTMFFEILKRQGILTQQVQMSSKIHFLTQFHVLAKTKKWRRVTELGARINDSTA